MEDSSTLRHHDVVDGAELKMHIWSAWASLVKESAKGNVSNVLDLGVTSDSPFQNANTNQMTPDKRFRWIKSRAHVALLVAAHGGHISLLTSLIHSGANIAEKTKHGRTVLHVAAASGKDDVVDLLLTHGAENMMNDKDVEGMTPLQCSSAAGHKSCARLLFLFQWQKRTAVSRKPPLLTRDDLMAHQLYDSKFKTWISGKQSQMYQSDILPPQEYQGTRLCAVRNEINGKKKTKDKKRANVTK